MRRIAMTLTIIALCATAAMAQQGTGGGGSGPRRAPDVPRLTPPMRIKGELLQVDASRNAIQIRSEQSKGKEGSRPMGFALDAKCKIKADKKEFGKKELELEELEAGYEVELTVRREDMLVIEMKVKKPKEDAGKEVGAKSDG